MLNHSGPMGWGVCHMGVSAPQQKMQRTIFRFSRLGRLLTISFFVLAPFRRSRYFATWLSLGSGTAPHNSAVLEVNGCSGSGLGSLSFSVAFRPAPRVTHMGVPWGTWAHANYVSIGPVRSLKKLGTRSLARRGGGGRSKFWSA